MTDRDDKRRNEARQHERGEREKREERREATGTREWIRTTEKELWQERTAFEGARDSHPRPENLEARLKADLEVLRKIDGLRPEVWKEATPEQRFTTLREAEGLLAYSQGREAYRTYTLADEETPRGGAASFLAVGQLDGPRIEDGWLRPNEFYVPEEDRAMRASQRFLVMPKSLLKGPNAADPRAAVTEFLHESRHGFQRAATDAPNRHSEVDALTIKLWKDGRASHLDDRRKADAGNTSAYATNPLETDANIYAKRLVDELYRDEREGDRR